MLFRKPADQKIELVCASRQSNLPRAAHLDKTTTSEQRLALLFAQIRSAADDGAQIIVLPEMTFNFDPQTEHTAELQSLADETNSYLVIDYVLGTKHGFHNEAPILSPAGNFLGVYAKTHPLITSGEPPSINSGNYSVYDMPLGKLAIMICFDADFTDVARHYGMQGAQLIAVPSLFGPTLSNLPCTQIVFRAIEN